MFRSFGEEELELEEWKWWMETCPGWILCLHLLCAGTGSSRSRAPYIIRYRVETLKKTSCSDWKQLSGGVMQWGSEGPAAATSGWVVDASAWQRQQTAAGTPPTPGSTCKWEQQTTVKTKPSASGEWAWSQVCLCVCVGGLWCSLALFLPFCLFLKWLLEDNDYLYSFGVGCVGSMETARMIHSRSRSPFVNHLFFFL